MRSLPNRTFQYVLLITVLILLLMDVFVWTKTKSFVFKEISAELHQQTELIRPGLNMNDLLAEDREKLKRFVDEIKSKTGNRITLINRMGEVLADSEVPLDQLPEVENHFRREEVQEALRTGSGLSMRSSATIHKRLFYYCETIKNRGKVVGFLRLSMFSPDYNQKLRFFISLILKVNIALLILIAIAYFLYVRWLQHYFSRFQKLLDDQRESADFKPLPPQSILEFDRLRRAINHIGLSWWSRSKEQERDKDELINVFDSINEGVAVFDEDNNAILCNRAFYEILQLERNNLKGQPYYTWIHYPPLLEDIETFLKSTKVLERRIKGYGETYIEYRIAPLKYAKGEKEGFLITLQNITKLQQLERIRRDFVANVSHEFKTPLTSIRGYSETLLLSDMIKDKTARNFLEKIIKQTKHLENLVSDLLQLSRIEKNETTGITRLNLLPIIREVAEDFHVLISSRKMTFNLEIPDDLTELRIEADPDLIKTLCSNLLSNAISYNRPGGTIWLRIARSADTVRIEVEDTGIGIPPREVDRIFERFYRTESAKEIYAEGSGLGLAIVKHIVELLKGHIKVKSEQGKGSLFRVELPLKTD